MKVGELIEKLRQYDPSAPAMVRVTAAPCDVEDVVTAAAEMVYATPRGTVVVEDGK